MTPRAGTLRWLIRLRWALALGGALGGAEGSRAGAAQLAQHDALAPRSAAVLPQDLQPLVQALQLRGFRVRIALPPARGAYGQFEARSRSIWVSPLSFELGIARQTFLHEAVHAAQSCPHGVLHPIGWALPLDPAVERGIGVILSRGYHPHTIAVEREAFALQGQPGAVAMVLQALKRRCPLAAERRKR